MGPQHKSEQKQDSVPRGSKQRHVFHNNVHCTCCGCGGRNPRSEVKKNPRDPSADQEVIYLRLDDFYGKKISVLL